VWRFVKTPGGIRVRVTIFLRDGMYSVCVAGKDEHYFHPERYATQSEALAVAFELANPKGDDSG
jgi:hypothetical protein